MFKRVICYLILILILSSCANFDPAETISPTVMIVKTNTPLPTKSLTDTQISTKTPTLTITPSPTPTPTASPDPLEDPDGDGYETYKEETWTTNPFEYTTFDDLKALPNAIYVKMKVSMPFATKENYPQELDIDEINSTVFQVIGPDYLIDDNGTPNSTWDDHLEFEAVLFPKAKQVLYPMEVSEFPIDPSMYPPEVQEYLVSKEDDVSNITDEMREKMLEVVVGAKTDVDAINRIISWNNQYLPMDPIYETYYPPYKQILNMKAGDMFADMKTRMSTTRATILNAELRAIGIPSRILFHISCHCNPNEDTGCDNRGNHPQNAVYIGGKWIIFDYVEYRALDPRQNPLECSVLTDAYRDNSEADFRYWVFIIDTPREYWPFELLYYIYERIEN